MTMNTRRILLALAGLILIALVGYGIWSMTTKDQRTEQPSIYRNGEFSYVFVYPSIYDLVEYTQVNVAVGTRTNKGMTALAEVTGIETLEAQTYPTYEQFLVAQMSTLCGVDSTALAKKCRGIESQEPFVASTGLEGILFYLTEDTTNLATGEVTTAPKGPFYAFNLTSVNPGTQFTAVVVRPPTIPNAEGVNTDMIRSIADTMMLYDRNAN